MSESDRSDEEYSEDEEDLEQFLKSRGQTETGSNQNPVQGQFRGTGPSNVNAGIAQTPAPNNEQPYPKEWKTWKRESESEGDVSEEETVQPNSTFQALNQLTPQPQIGGNNASPRGQNFANPSPNQQNSHMPISTMNHPNQGKPNAAPPCEICGEPNMSKFRHRNYHIVTHFKDELLADLKDRTIPYKCPMIGCKSSTKTQPEWVRHYGIDHNKMIPFLQNALAQTRGNHSGNLATSNQSLPAQQGTQYNPNSHMGLRQGSNQQQAQQYHQSSPYQQEQRSMQQQYQQPQAHYQPPFQPSQIEQQAQDTFSQENEEEIVEQEEEEEEEATVYKLSMGEDSDKEYFVELKDYESVKEERDKFIAENKAKSEQLAKSLKENNEKLAHFNDFNNRIAKLEQEKVTALTEARSAKMMVKELRKASSHTPVSNVGAEDVVKLETDNNLLKQEISKLEQEKASSKMEAINAQQDAREKMEIALNEVKKATEAEKAIKMEKEKLQHDLQTRERANQELSFQLNRLTNQYNVVDEKLRISEGERQGMAEGNEYREKYAEIFSANQARMGEISQMKLQIDRVSNENAVKTQQILDMEKNYNQLKEANGTIRQLAENEFAMKRNELENLLQEKHFLIEKAQRENAVERANSESMSRRIVELEQRNKQLQEINAAVKQAETDIMVESKQKLEIALEEVKKANAAEKALNKEKKEYQNEIDQSKKVITALNSQLKYLKQRAESKGANLDIDPKTKQELEESKKVIAELNVKLKEAKNASVKSPNSDAKPSESDNRAIESYRNALEAQKQVNSSLTSQLKELQTQTENQAEQIGAMEISQGRLPAESKKGGSTPGSSNLHAVAQKRLAEISQLKMINDRITRENNMLTAEIKDYRGTKVCKIAGHVDGEDYKKIKEAFLENNQVKQEDKSMISDSDITEMATELMRKHTGMKRHYESEIMNSVDKIRKLGRKVFEQASMEKLSNQLAVNETAVATLNKKLLATVKELKTSQAKAIKMEDSVKKFSRIAQTIKEMDNFSNKKIAEEKATLSSRQTLEETKMNLFRQNQESFLNRTSKEEDSPLKFSRSPLMKNFATSRLTSLDFLNRRTAKEESPARKRLEERFAMKRKLSEEKSDNEDDATSVVIDILGPRQKIKSLPSQPVVKTLPKQPLKKLEKYDKYENYE